MKKFSLYASTLLVLLAIAVTAGVSHVTHVSAQVSSGPLQGWIWSDNIGWISFNCLQGGPSANDICSTSQYSVTKNQDGTLTGYAWSDSIGWIKFGGLSGFPSDSGTVAQNAYIDGSGVMHGWALACAGTMNGDCTGGSRTDGWDGWISFSGTDTAGDQNSAYNIAVDPSGAFSGWAWGSDVVGWINATSDYASSTNPQDPTPCDPDAELCSFTPTPVASATLLINSQQIATVNTGLTATPATTATLSWSVANVSSCTASSAAGDWTGDISVASPTGTQTVGPFSSPGTATYQLNCIAADDATVPGASVPSNTVSLIVTTATSTPVNSKCTPVVNATMCAYEGTATSSLSGTTVVGSSAQCTATALSPQPQLCEYYCNTGFRQLGTGATARCVLNSTIQEN